MPTKELVCISGVISFKYGGNDANFHDGPSWKTFMVLGPVFGILSFASDPFITNQTFDHVHDCVLQ